MHAVHYVFEYNSYCKISTTKTIVLYIVSEHHV